MSAETVLKSTLDDSAGVGAVCANRIYPNKLPQDVTLPAVSYLVVATNHGGDLQGDNAGLDRVMVQVDCWGSSYSDVKSLSAAVRTAMKTPASGRAMILDARDTYEDENETHRVSLDFYIWN